MGRKKAEEDNSTIQFDESFYFPISPENFKNRLLITRNIKIELLARELHF